MPCRLTVLNWADLAVLAADFVFTVLKSAHDVKHIEQETPCVNISA